MDMFLMVAGWSAFVAAAFVLFWKWNQSVRSDAELQALKSSQVDLAGSYEARIAELKSENTSRLQHQAEDFERRLLTQKQDFDQSLKTIQDRFQSLSSQVLKAQSEDFLRLASERLDKKTIEGQAAFDQKVQSFQKLVEPIRETLQRVEGDLKSVEKDRATQFGQMREHLVQVAQQSESLRREAQQLGTALRRPEVRGSWGEIQLRRVVELAGMSPYCDFEEQVTTRSEDRLLKPDMIVRLPNERVIVVDSKAVFDAFLDAIQTDDHDRKHEALLRHAKNIRVRVMDLSRKSYWEQFENSPDFCVLFIPNEALLAAAVEVDRGLIEDALQEKIIIATPTTLVALLKAVAFGWQQNQMTENAQKIIASAHELYERVATWVDHFSKVGDRLQLAVKSYNDSVGSLESRVLPSVRRMQDLGLNPGKEIESLEPIDSTARALASQSEADPPPPEDVAAAVTTSEAISVNAEATVSEAAAVIVAIDMATAVTPPPIDQAKPKKGKAKKSVAADTLEGGVPS